MADFVLPLSGTFPDVDELAVAIHYLVIRAQVAFRSKLGREADTLDLSAARLGVLRILYYADGRRLPMKEIGGKLAVTAGNITRLVDGLVDHGYIRRDTPEANRRMTFAELTPAGAAAFKVAMPIILRSNRRRLDLLSPEEKETLIRLLTKLRQGLLSDYE